LPNDWTTPSDSGSIDVTDAKGEITGMCEYNGHLIVFTEFGMHELYGDSPSNFTLINVEGQIGCVSNKSIVKCNKRIYWVWIDGCYEYNGASPVRISDAVREYFDSISYSDRSVIAAGSIGDFLYISIPYSASVNDLVLVYDTRLRKWSVETGAFVDFVAIQNSVYGLNSVSNNVYNMRDEDIYTDNSTAISWEMITKPFHEGGLSQKKTLRDVSVVYNCSTSATASVSYSPGIDSTDFTVLATSSDFSRTNIKTNKILQIPTSALQNADWYRLKFSGTGEFSLDYLERNYRIGS